MGRRAGGDVYATARRACDRGAWEEALAALHAVPDEQQRTATQLELLATASYGAGDLEATLTAWEDLHALHRRAGDVVPAARAAAMVAMYLMMDTGLMSPVRGWLARVDQLLADHADTPVAANAAMCRAYERLLSGDTQAAGRWARRAVELGDRHPVEALPARTLGRVARARVEIFDGDVDGGLDALDEVAVMLMSGEVDALTAGMAYCELICAMQGLAQHDRVEEWTRAMDRRRRRGEFFGGINGRCRVHRAELLRFRGSCEEAEDEALHACEELRPWMRREFGWPLTELGNIRLRRGDHAGADEAFLAAHANGWDPQPGLAQLRYAQGDLETAATMIGDALERPIAIPSKERPPIGGLTRAPLLLTKVSIDVATGDVDGARSAADELASIADTYRSAGLRADADLALGQVALASGEGQVAVDRCRAAVQTWIDIGAPYEAAAARLVLADAYAALERDDLASLEREAAETSLAGIGAAPLVAPAGRASPPRSSDTEAAVFRCDGDTRAIGYAGRQVVLRDLKGMRYLARLLAEPGREFHALDLVAVESGSLPTAGPGAARHELEVGAGHAGPLIDDQARAAYRRRLEEIERDIEDAEAKGDAERAALARADRDFIVSELSRAFGLGGRQRLAASATERARVSVTRVVRYSIARIAEQHAELGDHLEHTVSTGTYCCYTPDPRVPIGWET